MLFESCGKPAAMGGGGKRLTRNVPEETLLAIQRHFHEVIRGRAAKLIDQHGLSLPELAPLLSSSEPKAWFPIPGTYGGFS